MTKTDCQVLVSTYPFLNNRISSLLRLHGFSVEKADGLEAAKAAITALRPQMIIGLTIKEAEPRAMLKLVRKLCNIDSDVGWTDGLKLLDWINEIELNQKPKFVAIYFSEADDALFIRVAKEKGALALFPQAFEPKEFVGFLQSSI